MYVERLTEVIGGRQIEFSNIPKLGYANYRLSIDGNRMIDCIENSYKIEIVAYDEGDKGYLDSILPVQIRGTECYSYLFCNYVRIVLLGRVPEEIIEDIVKLFSSYTQKEYINREFAYTSINYSEFNEATRKIDKRLNKRPYSYFLVEDCIYSSFLVTGREYIKLQLDECVISVMSLLVLGSYDEERLREDMSDLMSLMVYLICHKLSILG